MGKANAPVRLSGRKIRKNKLQKSADGRFSGFVIAFNNIKTGTEDEGFILDHAETFNGNAVDGHGFASLSPIFDFDTWGQLLLFCQVIPAESACFVSSRIEIIFE